MIKFLSIRFWTKTASSSVQGKLSVTDCGRWSKVFRSSMSMVPQLSSREAAPTSIMIIIIVNGGLGLSPLECIGGTIRNLR